jgi:uncharacterized protein YegJ (DUF2314 family)
MWWKRKLDLHGDLYFRGSLSPSLSGLRGLESASLDVRVLQPESGELWAAELRHGAWGQARLSAPRDAQVPPEIIVSHASGLTPKERERIVSHAQSVLKITMSPHTADVLRDRKLLLQFMTAVLGSEGVAAFDVRGWTFWTPDRLADEVRHDAALDIIHVHVLHLVTQAEGIWLHSHGLSEMGFVDFDVLRPAEAVIREQFDLLRAIAFQIAEGRFSGPVEPALGAPPIELVDAKAFMNSASKADRDLREADQHTEKRVVCCEPHGTGLVGRLLGPKNWRPSGLLSRGMVEGKQLVVFSDNATQLMAERARESLSLLGPLREEFLDLQCTALVKMRYPVDDGSGNEHLWFEVHGIGRDTIDATLINEPFGIAKLKAGNRAQRPVEFLSDWSVMTPIGQITPRSLELARQLREVRPMVEHALRSQPNPEA